MPHRLYWLTLLLGAFFVSLPHHAARGQTPTLGLREIVAALDSLSPALADARADLARARASYTGSGALPNPTLFGTHEALDDDAGTIEQMIGVRQNLGFLWSQRPRRATARREYDALQAVFEESRREVVIHTIKLAFELDRVRSQAELLDSVLSRTDKLAAATTARYKEGDVSLYDEQRVQLERVQLRQRSLELAGEEQQTLTDLVQLTGFDADKLSVLRIEMPPPNSTATADEAAALAMSNRPELTHVRKQREAAEHALAQARWNQMPDFAIGIGSKMVEPGPSGLYVEGELELPLWSQRRSAIQSARAEVIRAQRHDAAQRSLVEQQARAAYHLLELASSIQLPEDATESALANMNRGVQLYLEDEMSALELVDALRTGIDAHDAALRLRNSLAVARAELRRAIGLEPME